MSYDAVIEQVKSVPEEYLDDISHYISNIINRHNAFPQKSGLRDFYGALNKNENSALKHKEKKNCNFEKYFGTLNLGDPLEIQKQMRDEWDY